MSLAAPVFSFIYPPALSSSFITTLPKSLWDPRNAIDRSRPLDNIVPIRAVTGLEADCLAKHLVHIAENELPNSPTPRATVNCGESYRIER